MFLGTHDLVLRGEQHTLLTLTHSKGCHASEIQGDKAYGKYAFLIQLTFEQVWWAVPFQAELILGTKAQEHGWITKFKHQLSPQKGMRSIKVKVNIF